MEVFAARMRNISIGPSRGAGWLRPQKYSQCRSHPQGTELEKLFEQFMFRRHEKTVDWYNCLWSRISGCIVQKSVTEFVNICYMYEQLCFTVVSAVSQCSVNKIYLIVVSQHAVHLMSSASIVRRLWYKDPIFQFTAAGTAVWHTLALIAAAEGCTFYLWVFLLCFLVVTR